VFGSVTLLAQESSSKVFIKKQYKTKYTQALKHYKNEEYEKAYVLFNELFLDNLDNILINYYLGRSAYFLEKYEFALSAYERILIQDPNNHRVRIELGQTYLKMKLFPQSLLEFTAVSKGNLPPKVKERVMKNIELLSNREKKYQLTPYAYMALMYDSNISNISEIREYDIYNPFFNGFIPTTNSSEKEGTMIVQTMVGLNYKYKLDDNLIWDNGIALANLKYNNHKEKDLQIFSFNSKPTYYMKDKRMSMNMSASRVRLGHASYQNTYDITPAVLFSVNKRTLFQTGVKLKRSDFYGENYTLDAKTVEWQNTLRYITQDYGLFGLGVNIGRENEVNEDRTDVTYNYYDVSVTNNYEIIKDYTLSNGIKYQRSNYAEFETTFQEYRKDNTYNYNIALEHKLSKDMVLSLGTSYTKRNSNITLYDYDKYVIKMSLYMNF
jgi:tetratricopeptide (TPR) repeat protein